ncbi:MAG: hypothetical protein WCQ95_00325 [Bacteroidota bacterium]
MASKGLFFTSKGFGFTSKGLELTSKGLELTSRGLFLPCFALKLKHGKKTQSFLGIMETQT